MESILIKRHILIIEDDIELTRLLKAFLGKHFTVSTCSQAHRAKAMLQEQEFDLILCDVNLPGKSGFELVSEVRNSFSKPILFMTARTDLASQLSGFELGAEDYLIKPIDPEILLAKINVFLSLKRHKSEKKTRYSCHNLEIDPSSKAVTLDGEALELTSAEFKLLEALVNHFGSVVSRDWLYQNHLGKEYDGMCRIMDGRASRLRKKLKLIDTNWDIGRQWGEGYYLEFSGTEQS